MNKLTSLLLILAAACCIVSCNTAINKIFTRQTPHEAYAKKIEAMPEAKQWLETSMQTLSLAQVVSLPYKQSGYFPEGKPRALSLLFNGKQGQQMHFNLASKSTGASVIFVDIFQKDSTGFSHFMAIDTNVSQFSFDVEDPGDYVIRLQPALFVTAAYDLTATILPSIGFPVAGDKARTGSFWGDARDGGQRSHEGVDIFAPKRTPVIATSDGFITGVKDGGIGGKTVWLRATGRNIHLYYAHLDSQLVREGDKVAKGDTLGLVGNTGNAQFTPAHLHFGVYTNRGPVDPYPFIHMPAKSPEQFPAKDLNVRLQLKPVKKRTRSEQPMDTTLLVPLAVNASGYIAEHPNGTIIQAPFTSVKVIKG